MTSIVVHTNGPVEETFYIIDNDDVPVAIPIGTFKSQWRKRDTDAAVAATFVTGGGVGLGTITRGAAEIEGVIYDVLVINADRALVADLEPGAYDADILRTDVLEWLMDYQIEVRQGVTEP